MCRHIVILATCRTIFNSTPYDFTHLPPVRHIEQDSDFADESHLYPLGQPHFEESPLCRVSKEIKPALTQVFRRVLLIAIISCAALFFFFETRNCFWETREY